MRTLAFVTQKGGSGKSTIASSLAVAAMEAGEKVAVVDTDPQKSLMGWAKTRGADDVHVEAATGAKLGDALKALAKKGYTLAIVDTPGADLVTVAHAIKASDLCVVPARPTAFDIWASAAVCKALKEHRKEFVFLLNQCPPAQQSARIEDGAKALEAMGGLVTPLVLSRVDFQDATRNGLGATEINAGGAAASEIRALWASLRRRLARAKPAARKAA
ncbi:MAG: ParA family protein [Hyphomicrobiales bacterium]|nr:ParA family protein [Hyphomicrobiales bacterium]MDE2017732.1 ParA family protein [Hyphomicrobiales bacterium]